MPLTASIKRTIKTRFPAPAAIAMKRLAIRPSYWLQMRACRQAWLEHGSAYEQNILFVAGLPKSGTTWLERMIASYPGFENQVRIPEAEVHELRTGGSHDFDLPDGVFDRFDRRLAVMKLHSHGSPQNVKVLREAGVRCVVLYRDLRDIAVSNYFYVRRTKWHPEYKHYKDVDLNEGLRVFAERSLGAYVDWIRSWRQNRDPETTLELRYEQILEAPVDTMRQVATLFGLDTSEERIREIVDRNSFQRMTGGRKPGEGDSKSFARKGKAGDWKNQFDATTKAVYKASIGGFLIETGYENDDTW